MKHLYMLFVYLFALCTANGNANAGRVLVPVGGGGLLHRLPAALLPRVDVRPLLPVVEAAVPRQRPHEPQRRAGPEQAVAVRPARRRRLQVLPTHLPKVRRYVHTSE